MNWIVDAFYNHDHSIGPGGSNFVAFSFTGAQAFTTSHVENENYAIFSQGGLDLSGLGARGLTFNPGFATAGIELTVAAGHSQVAMSLSPNANGTAVAEGRLKEIRDNSWVL
jgi:hypothetical protein